MVVNTKESGNLVGPAGKANLFILVAISMKESGSEIKQTDTGLTQVRTKRSIQAHGEMTKSMGMREKLNLMDRFMMGSL